VSIPGEPVIVSPVLESLILSIDVGILGIKINSDVDCKMLSILIKLSESCGMLLYKIRLSMDAILFMVTRLSDEPGIFETSKKVSTEIGLGLILTKDSIVSGIFETSNKVSVETGLGLIVISSDEDDGKLEISSKVSLFTVLVDEPGLFLVSAASLV
tara:strand:+ start:35 stop:505 length:471 start_codon:yes stop_codon:yes gene_type:complete